jgi:hypothetical protein
MCFVSTTPILIFSDAAIANELKVKIPLAPVYIWSIITACLPNITKKQHSVFRMVELQHQAFYRFFIVNRNGMLEPEKKCKLTRLLIKIKFPE